MKSLSEFFVMVKGVTCGLFSNVNLICGIGPTGDPVPMSVGADGSLDGGSTAVSLGVAGVRFTSGDQSGSTAAVTDLPETGKTLVITDIRYSSDTALRIDFIDASNTFVLFSEFVPANGSGQITLRGKVKLAAPDTTLGVQTSIAGSIAITAAYYSE